MSQTVFHFIGGTHRTSSFENYSFVIAIMCAVCHKVLRSRKVPLLLVTFFDSFASDWSRSSSRGSSTRIITTFIVKNGDKKGKMLTLLWVYSCLCVYATAENVSLLNTIIFRQIHPLRRLFRKNLVHFSVQGDLESYPRFIFRIFSEQAAVFE